MTDSSSRLSIRMAHVADLHIGAGYVHGTEDAGGVNSRLHDFRAAWVRSCEQMVEDEVDIVVVAGDGFRDAKPTPTEQEAMCAGLDVLAERDIPVIMTVGNHDIPRQVGRTNALAIFDEYDNVSVMDRPGVVFGGDVLLPVACFPYPSRAHVAAVDPTFESMTIDEQNARLVELSMQVLRKLGAEADKYGSPFGCVLVAHGSITGSQIGAEGSTAFLREAVLPLSELRGLPFRYQAWGHLHRAQQLAPSIRYSGSLERVDFSEAEEDKGWWLVELHVSAPEGVASWDSIEWRSSAPRPFMDIDLSMVVEHGVLNEWCDGLDLSKILAPDFNGNCAGAVVRVRYTATPEVAKTIDQAAIRRALYAAGAVKVHGPMAMITHTVTADTDAVTEETDILSGWKAWADLQGLNGSQRTRLDLKVAEALEVTS